MWETWVQSLGWEVPWLGMASAKLVSDWRSTQRNSGEWTEKLMIRITQVRMGCVSLVTPNFLLSCRGCSFSPPLRYQLHIAQPLSKASTFTFHPYDCQTLYIIISSILHSIKGHFFYHPKSTKQARIITRTHTQESQEEEAWRTWPLAHSEVTMGSYLHFPSPCFTEFSFYKSSPYSTLLSFHIKISIA